MIQCHQLGSSKFWRVLHLCIYNFLNCFSTHVSIFCSFTELYSLELSDTFWLMCAFTCIEHSNHYDSQLILLCPFFHPHPPLSSPQTQHSTNHLYSLIKTYVASNTSMCHNFWFNGSISKHLTSSHHVYHQFIHKQIKILYYKLIIQNQ